MHFIKSVKSASHIVRLKADREEKQTDGGRLFHTLTTMLTNKIPLKIPGLGSRSGLPPKSDRLAHGYVLQCRRIL